MWVTLIWGHRETRPVHCGVSSRRLKMQVCPAGRGVTECDRGPGGTSLEALVLI